MNIAGLSDIKEDIDHILDALIIDEHALPFSDLIESISHSAA